MKKYTLVLLLCIAIVSISCANSDEITITTPNKQRIVLEIATTDEARQLGLMFRTSLESDRGMIFVFPDNTIRMFWMKNTYIPLSIAYLDMNGVVVHIADMTPLSLEGISSLYAAKYAIELNQGMFDTLNIKKGTRLTLPKTLLRKVE